ncbi:hypothetical protein [Tatumella sp. UBA2305]|nr:hypothetical protein [Tatumella sp. UBA2305]
MKTTLRKFSHPLPETFQATIIELKGPGYAPQMEEPARFDQELISHLQ